MLFSEALTHARTRHGLSRTDLSDATGVSYKHIANLEAGKRRPSIPIVTKLHTCLRFPQRVLLALFEECPEGHGAGG